MLKKWAQEVHYGQQNAQQCPSCKVTENCPSLLASVISASRCTFKERKAVIILFVFAVKRNFVINVVIGFEISNLLVRSSPRFSSVRYSPRSF